MLPSKNQQDFLPQYTALSVALNRVQYRLAVATILIKISRKSSVDLREILLYKTIGVGLISEKRGAAHSLPNGERGAGVCPANYTFITTGSAVSF